VWLADDPSQSHLIVYGVWLQEAMLTQIYIHLGVALAGLVSFLSPCVLPLVPPYLGYLGGTTIDQLGSKDEIDPRLWRRVVLASVFFVLGFTTVFVGFGAGASVLGQWIQAHKHQLSVIAGIVIIAFGLHFVGVLRIPLLYREARFHSNRQGASLAGGYVMGLAFAFGWTPCIGPVLTAVLTLAANEASLGAGVRLLFVYSLGLGIPFILAAVAIGPFLGFLKRFRKHLGRVEMVMGVLLILAGVLMLTGGLNWFGTWMIENVPVLARIEELFTPKQLQTDILKEGTK
jgi:cytochrome c-type biogenesis protein